MFYDGENTVIDIKKIFYMLNKMFQVIPAVRDGRDTINIYHFQYLDKFLPVIHGICCLNQDVQD